MASNVAETSSSIEQIAATIEKNSRNISDANDLALKARDEAKQGGNKVLQTVEGMKSITAAMSQVSEVIRNLGERSAAIGGILEVIEEIADQTNLLALNAAIEAARAGDAGRGFAVVADEVRKLAERSIQSTQEIAQVVKQVQAETAAAVRVTQESAAEAKGSSELADRAGEGIGKILGLVENTSLLMQDIATATREQSAGVTQVVKAAENMTEMTEQVRNATFEQKKGGQNVVTAVENISEISRANLASVEQLARSAKDMSREAEGLQGLIRQFKVA
jgi:methyl-accepting chemotaxis protein